MSAAKKKKSATARGMTKSAMISEVAASAGITKDQANKVFDHLFVMISRELKGPSGQFTLPNIAKIQVKHKGGPRRSPRPQPRDRRDSHHQSPARQARGQDPGAQGRERDHLNVCRE